MRSRNVHRCNYRWLLRRLARFTTVLLLVALLLLRTRLCHPAHGWCTAGPFYPDKHRFSVSKLGAAQGSLFSSSYVGWGAIRSGGKQLQYGHTLPALVLSRGGVRIERDSDRCYSRSEFWLAAGPVLVWNGKPVPVHEMKRQFPNLPYHVRRRRVAAGLLHDGGVLFVTGTATIPELQRKLLALGIQRALNLDGGSCTVWRHNGITILGSRIHKGSYCISISNGSSH